MTFVGPTEPGAALSPAALRAAGADGFGPWTSADLVRTAVCNAVGLLMVGVSWDQAAGQTLIRNELFWLELGLLGVAVAATGNALWILSGRRHVGLARTVVLPHRRPRPAPAGPARSAQAADPGGNTDLWAGPTMTRYHRPDCPFLQDKAAQPASREDHQAAGRMPCELCEP